MNNINMTDTINDNIYHFIQTNVTINMNGLPPPPITWIYNMIDIICYYSLFNNKYCSMNWRQSILQYINPSSLIASWLSLDYKIPDVSIFKPELLSFQDYYLMEQQQLQQQQVDDSSLFNTILHYIYTWYRYAFYTSSTSLGELTTLTSIMIVLCIVLPLLRYIKSICIPYFCNIGYHAALQTHGTIWVQENQIRIEKFGEYIFRLIYHSMISIYGIYYFQNEIWWNTNHTIYVFRNYPNHTISPSMAWYYIIQSSYNLDALITLLQMSFTIQYQSIIKTKSNKQQSSVSKKSNTTTNILSTIMNTIPIQLPICIQWNTKSVRGDFQEMLIHHIITNALVIGSSMLRFTRIGSMVFLIHDISDVPVDLSKLANFLKWKITTIICFGTMSFTWLYTRLYILPFKIYYTTITKSHYVLESGTVPVILYVCYRHFFYIFLGLLILLHTAWFAMFVRMFHTLIMKRELHDYSEHKNGEPPTVSTTTASSTTTTTNGTTSITKKTD